MATFVLLLTFLMLVVALCNYYSIPIIIDFLRELILNVFFFLINSILCYLLNKWIHKVDARVT